MVLRVMAFAFRPEGRRVGVEGAKIPSRFRRVGPLPCEHARERRHCRSSARAVATVAASIISRADCAAASMGNRTKAGRAMRDGHADIAAPLALRAYTVAADDRIAPNQEGRHELEHLLLVDGASPQLEINIDMIV